MFEILKRIKKELNKVKEVCEGLKYSEVEELLYEAPLDKYILPIARDEETGLYILENGYVGFALKSLPLPLVGEETIKKFYINLYRDSQIPEDTIIGFTLHGSQRVEPLFWNYQKEKNNFQQLEKSIKALEKALVTAGEEERKKLLKDINFLKWVLSDALSKRELVELLDFYEKWLRQKTYSKLTPSWFASLKDFWLYIWVQFPVSISEFPEKKDRLFNLKEQILTSLKVIGVPFIELNEKEYLRIVRFILNPDYPTEFIWEFAYLESKELREQVVFDGTLVRQYENGIFRIGKHFFRTLTVPFGYYGYPKEVSFLEILELFGSLRGIDSYQIYTPFMLSFVAKKLNGKEWTSLNSQGNLVLKQQLPGAISKLKERKEDFFLLLQKKQEEHEEVFTGILTMTLYHTDKEVLEENAEVFQKIANNQGYKFLKEELPLPFFLSQVPLNTFKEIFDKKFARGQILFAENCAHLTPVSADWKGTETAVVPMVSRRGQQMFFHLWDTDGGSNYAIVAPMGAGKSFFGNHLLFNYATLPNSLIRVIDIGDSYWGLCQLVGGRYERFTVAKSCLNPFYFITPEGGETQISFLTNFIGALGRWNSPITDEEKGLITQALLKAIERWGSGFNLEEVVKLMVEIAKQRKNKDLVEFAELAFTAWLPEGQYGNLLNGEPTLKFDNRFIVLELGEARDDYHLLAIVLISYLFMTTKEIMTLPRNIYKILHIDEAWRVLQTKHFMVMDAIEQGIREYRKFGGALGIVTQYIKDLFPTDNDPISQKLKAMKNNIEYFFLFRQPTEEWERMKEDKDIYLSDFEVELAKTIRTVKGEYSEAYVISRSRGRGIARVVVPPEFRWLYTTDPKEVAKRNEVYAQTKDIKATIEILSQS